MVATMNVRDAARECEAKLNALFRYFKGTKLGAALAEASRDARLVYESSTDAQEESCGMALYDSLNAARHAAAVCRRNGWRSAHADICALVGEFGNAPFSWVNADGTVKRSEAR